LNGIAALLFASAVAASGHVAVTLPDGVRIELLRGREPVLSVIPRAGDGWIELARRYGAKGEDSTAELAAANRPLAFPRRGVRVRLPWRLASGVTRLEALKALFPADHVSETGWEHVEVAPWGGESESWLELATLFSGGRQRYAALRRANPTAPLFPRRGARLLIPPDLLEPGLRLAALGATAPVPTPVPPSASEPTAEATPEPGQGVSATAAAASVLEYRKDFAIYRLRAGEALYSAVVVRFTGQLHASDVNATAVELAKRSGIAEVTSIPVGFPVRIPFDLLLPEYLPPGNPRRVAWEKEREELTAIRRVIRAANLDGIHVILDAGHGGADTGATAGGLWESTYVYDVMARLKNVLEKETRATVWALERDTKRGWETPDVDVLPRSRTQELLVDPPYDLSESAVGVHLRWVLTDSILQRLERQHVDPERVVFVSIHADSLHPAVRGLMVYTPARRLRPRHASVPDGLYRCRETARLSSLRFPVRFLARSEALSTQLGTEIAREAARFNIPVHDFEPVRSSVLRGRSRWVPAVLRYSRVPTSVLIEICNLNNDRDRALLTTWRFREKLAHAIAAGLAEAFSR
jgi:N-acetylmuramoyl-L-alanine amidase